SGWFYREYTQGTGYRRWNVTAHQCPRHSAEFLADEKRKMGDWWFNAAYLNRFGADLHAVFRPEDVDRAFSKLGLPRDDEFVRGGPASAGISAVQTEPPVAVPTFGMISPDLAPLE